MLLNLCALHRYPRCKRFLKKISFFFFLFLLTIIFNFGWLLWRLLHWWNYLKGIILQAVQKCPTPSQLNYRCQMDNMKRNNFFLTISENQIKLLRQDSLTGPMTSLFFFLFFEVKIVGADVARNHFKARNLTKSRIATT